MNGLDRVAVRISNACCEVVAVELVPDARRPVRASAGLHGCGVEGLDGPGVIRCECELERARRLRLAEPQRARCSLDPEPGSTPVRPIEKQNDAEGTQRFLVETPAHGVIPDREGDVVDDDGARIERSCFSVKGIALDPQT
jgi:hypothetical protein